MQLLLASFSGIMSLMIIAVWLIPDPESPKGASKASEIVGASATVGTKGPAGTLVDLRERPPFWPDRQVPVPIVAPAPAAPPVPPPPPLPLPSAELTLIGIVNGPEGRIAVLRVKASGKLERHVEGETVEQWILARILIDRLVLVRGGSEDELTFPPPRERKSAQSAPPGPPRSPLQFVPLAPPTQRR